MPKTRRGKFCKKRSSGGAEPLSPGSVEPDPEKGSDWERLPDALEVNCAMLQAESNSKANQQLLEDMINFRKAACGVAVALSLPEVSANSLNINQFLAWHSPENCDITGDAELTNNVHYKNLIKKVTALYNHEFIQLRHEKGRCLRAIGRGYGINQRPLRAALPRVTVLFLAENYKKLKKVPKN
tara:strand:+ start:765 stop:1316 length:552 start_codon:yes stop_codon:yes gene_type:complete